MSDSETVIRVENLGKRYNLGLIHHDLIGEKITAGLHWAAGGLRRLFTRRDGSPSSIQHPAAAQLHGNRPPGYAVGASCIQYPESSIKHRGHAAHTIST